LAVALSTPLAKVSQTQRDATATFSFLEEEEEEDLAGDFGQGVVKKALSEHKPPKASLSRCHSLLPIGIDLIIPRPDRTGPWLGTQGTVRRGRHQ
jgi:hypothetical protein